MRSELLTAYVSGGGALLGAALGIGGALGAARIQTKGATAQAEAARDAAVTQAEAVLKQQARDARRPVYTQALAAGRAYRASLHAHAETGADPDAFTDTTERLENAPTQVEFEGPLSSGSTSTRAHPSELGYPKRAPTQ
ncbi:hypothetical protein ACIRSU_02700 [Streptomyces sp. NPDC101160]|uniref:hypothetical protein n=1 Tax=Streptomyces sp. NPDC101160 TaxID=3366118 RepID=UPI0037FE89AD